VRTTTSNRLKQIMSDRNLRQVDILNMVSPFAKELNIRFAKNDLSQYVSGKVEPSQEKLTVLSRALNVSEPWLMGYDVAVDIDNSKKSEVQFIGRANIMRTYRYIDAKASAGSPIDIAGQDYSTIAIPDSMLGKYAKYSEEDLLFMHITGDSMDKTIPDGSLIGVLGFKSTVDINNGDIVLFNHDYGYSVKRYFYDQENNRIIFRPESNNPIYTDIIYNLDEDHVEIIGKVIMYNVTLD
jgi:phage repressor protein C with HTH and peptisase S24 domain